MNDPETNRKHGNEADRLRQWDWDIHELYWPDLRVRLGESVDTRSQAKGHLALSSSKGNRRYVARCHALLGRLTLLDDRAAARQHLAHARDWATRTGDLEVILQVHQLAAAIHRATIDLDAAFAELNEGIRIADGHGAGLFSIDLRLDRARLHLERNDPVAAQRDAREALDRATEPECGYAWGEADAAHLLGEAHLARHDKVNAVRYFEQELEVRTRMGHPDAEVIHRRLAALR